MQKADMLAFTALVERKLEPATAYTTWCEKQSYASHTRSVYGAGLPLPLNHWLPWSQRRAALRRFCKSTGGQVSPNVSMFVGSGLAAIVRLAYACAQANGQIPRLSEAPTGAVAAGSCLSGIPLGSGRKISQPMGWVLTICMLAVIRRCSCCVCCSRSEAAVRTRRHVFLWQQAEQLGRTAVLTPVISPWRACICP